MTNPHDRDILRLALPAFAALVAEPLFLLVDTAIVARLGTAPLGALGVAGTALATAAGLCVFLAYGTTAAVARQVGAGEMVSAINRGIDGLWLAAVLGIVLIAVGWPSAPLIVEAFGASAAIAPHAITYLRISLIGLPGMLIVLAGTGVLRGLQDTVTPLVVSVASFTANAALSAVFVLGFGWGIAGSAWGTVLAQSAGAVVYGVVVARGARRLSAHLLPERAGVTAAASAGLALMIRTASLRVVLLIAAGIAARMGDAHIAAHQVAFQVWTLLAFALDAIAIAGQAITGRLLGAGDISDIRAATRRMVAWGIGSGFVFGGAVLATTPFIPGLFTSDPEVTRELLAVLLAVALMQPIAGIVFVLDGVLIGAGDQRYLAVAGVLATLAFLPAALAVLATGSLMALWLALGVWMLARLGTLGIRARGGAWLITGAKLGR